MARLRTSSLPTPNSSSSTPTLPLAPASSRCLSRWLTSSSRVNCMTSLSRPAPSVAKRAFSTSISPIFWGSAMKSCMPFVMTEDDAPMCSVFNPLVNDCSVSLIFDRVINCPCSEHDFHRCFDYANMCGFDTLRPRSFVFRISPLSDFDFPVEV